MKVGEKEIGANINANATFSAFGRKYDEADDYSVKNLPNQTKRRRMKINLHFCIPEKQIRKRKQVNLFPLLMAFGACIKTHGSDIIPMAMETVLSAGTKELINTANKIYEWDFCWPRASDRPTVLKKQSTIVFLR